MYIVFPKSRPLRGFNLRSDLVQVHWYQHCHRPHYRDGCPSSNLSKLGDTAIESSNDLYYYKGKQRASEDGPWEHCPYNPCNGTGRVKVTVRRQRQWRKRQREFLEKVTESGGCHQATMRRVSDEITQFVIWTVPPEVRSCSMRALARPQCPEFNQQLQRRCHQLQRRWAGRGEQGEQRRDCSRQRQGWPAGGYGAAVSEVITYTLCSALEKYRPGLKGWNDFNLTFLFRGNGY